MDVINQYRSQVERYCKSVKDGTRVTGKLEQLAVARHLHDLEHAHKRGFHFDEKKAAETCSFFPTALRMTKGEWMGRPFVLSDPQAFMIWCLYGWRKTKEDGKSYRRFNYAYLTMARKFGKSEFAAGIGLRATVCDDPLEYGAEVYCAATKEDQAKIVHNTAQQMVQLGPLKKHCNVFAKAISTPITSPLQPSSFFKPLGSDSKTSDGFNLHVAILDEVHEWRERHRGLYEKLTTASGARNQPMIVIITTAGDDFSVIWQEIDNFCVQVLEGYKQEKPPGDSWFAFIARVDEKRPCECRGRNNNCKLCEGTGEIPGDDPLDEKNWPKANPNYPTTPKREFLRQLADDAAINPAVKNAFTRYHANSRVSSLEKAIAAATWNAAAGTLSEWSTADCITGGWDLGGRDDLAALGLVARFDTGKWDDSGNTIYRYEVKCQAYLSTDAERDLSRDPWRDWVYNGQIKCVKNELAELKKDVIAEFHKNMVKQWAFDPHTSRDLAQDVATQGIDCVVFNQSVGMYNEPLRTFLSALKRGRITHDGNSLLSWFAQNVVIRANNMDEWMPDKKASADKIDGFVAILMAFRLAMLAPSRARGSLFVC